MTQEQILEFTTKTKKGLFVHVPNDIFIKKYEIKLIPNNSTILISSLKHYKNEPIVIHQDQQIQYKILGLSHKLTENIIEEMGITFSEYLQLLYENDITTDYSKYTGKWLVLLNPN